MTQNLESNISQTSQVESYANQRQSLRCPRSDTVFGALSQGCSTRKTGMTSMSVVRVVFLLVGVLFGTHTALAQAVNECPVPPDTAPVVDPEVTAQQVVADDTNLGEFTRLVRDRFKSYSQTVTSVTQIAYFGCVLREEEGPWRTSTVYPILVTPFGRIVFHTEDMTLSGRLIDPAVLGTIYSALGVSHQDIADLRSADVNTRNRARRSILMTLAEEKDTAFDATAPIPGVRPGIPGAKGHVAVYVGRAFQIPLLVLGGFDLGSRHVVEEMIDYGDPSVTAADVVDRDTLKQFVIEAGNYFIEAQRDAGDAILGSVAKIAMRDRNGPWRHGSVYIYVLDLRSNIIFFHGADANRFEFRPLIPTVRDAVTGEYILDNVIEAAKSGPEGGFVRYYFDDPTDDTDSADIPKIGYAREFAGTVETFSGAVIPSNYIVGSGFYLTSPAVVALRQNKVVETVLPQVMRTTTASTVDAIAERIQQAMSGSGAPASTVINLGSPTTLSAALRNRSEGSFLSNWLADGSHFLLPLNATHGGDKLLSQFTFWGNFDYRKLTDDNMEVMGYDGTVTSANFGIDRKIGESLVGGVSLTLSRGTTDYTDPELAKGELSTSLTSVNPFVGWRITDNARVWAAAGFGGGQVDFKESTNEQSTDISQSMFAAGLNFSLMSSDQLIGGGTTSLKLNTDTAFTSADIDAGDSIEETSLEASRYRVSLEGLYTRKLASEAVLTPSIEAGWRHDGGDGTTGSGLEIGAGIGYTVGRLMVKLDSQTLVTHSDADDYTDWSFSSMVSYEPSSNGQGLSMSLGSAWGLVNRDIGEDTVGWFKDARARTQREARLTPAPWIHATVRYDFNRPYGLGLWTSYRGTDSDDQFRLLQVGLQFRSGQGLNAGLKIGRQERFNLAPDHSVELRGTIRW